MDILETIFGSSAKVKLLKLFLLNPEHTFDLLEASDRTQSNINLVKKEITDLEKIGFVKTRSYLKEVNKQKDRTVVLVKKRVDGWTLDPKFPYLTALEAFISNVNPFKHKEIIDKISRAGKIDLLIISGVFIKYEDARVDLLVVGDGIRIHSLENIIKTIESEIGKEIRYAVFETSEFKYRHSLFDKLIMDILDFPNEKIINKLGL